MRWVMIYDRMTVQYDRPATPRYKLLILTRRHDVSFVKPLSELFDEDQYYYCTNIDPPTIDALTGMRMASKDAS